MPAPETYPLLLAAASACEDKKAEDIRILALDPTESGLADYFLICNGTNERQNVAIADEIDLRLKRDLNTLPRSVEGRRQAEWILMDYVDFIVHIFSPEKRAYYGLERLRKSAVTLSVEDINAEMKAAIAASRSRATKSPAKQPAAAKKAPAKSKKVASSPARGNSKAPKTATKPAAKKTVKKAATKVAKKKAKR